MPRVGDAAAIVESRRRSSPDAIAERVVQAIERDRARLFMWGPAGSSIIWIALPGPGRPPTRPLQRQALARAKS